jgi:hypothetical protein
MLLCLLRAPLARPHGRAAELESTWAAAKCWGVFELLAASVRMDIASPRSKGAFALFAGTGRDLNRWALPVEWQVALSGEFGRRASAGPSPMTCRVRWAGKCLTNQRSHIFANFRRGLFCRCFHLSRRTCCCFCLALRNRSLRNPRLPQPLRPPRFDPGNRSAPIRSVSGLGPLISTNSHGTAPLRIGVRPLARRGVSSSPRVVSLADSRTTCIRLYSGRPPIKTCRRVIPSGPACSAVTTVDSSLRVITAAVMVVAPRPRTCAGNSRNRVQGRASAGSRRRGDSDSHRAFAERNKETFGRLPVRKRFTTFHSDSPDAYASAP